MHLLTKECGQVSWDASTDEIVNLVGELFLGRELSHLIGELLKIWKASSAERKFRGPWYYPGCRRGWY